jgi:hypothetical protein
LKPRFFAFLTLTAFSALVLGTGRAQVPSAVSDLMLNSNISTLYGPTGLIKVPTAYTVAHEDVEVGMTFGDQFSASGNYGVWKSIEAGLGVLDNGSDDDSYLVNAKIDLMPSNFKGFELGLGVVDLFDDANQTFYGVGSLTLWTPKKKQFFSGVRGHVGYGTGFYDDNIIGGAEVFIGSKMAVVGEYDGIDVNFAARYVYSKAVRLELGWADDAIYFSTSSEFRP